jgi:putative ABC transport system substrate-binding protein
VNSGAKNLILKFFFWLLTTVLLTSAWFADAQQSTKIFKIGWFSSVGGQSSELGIINGLRALGYIEGKNIIFEYRSAQGKLDRLPALADELVRLKVDVIVATGTQVALAAKDATKSIPIVFTSGADPVSAGLIDSLARPGGNLTGLSTISGELTGKRLELLKETVRNLSRVAVLWHPRAASSVQQWKESQLPARELGLQLHSMEVTSADKFASAFNDAIRARSSALAVTSAPVNNSNQKQIADLAAKHRLPTISPWPEFVANGGLMSYGANDAERYRRAAYLIDRILKGAAPADLPVEQPMGFEFNINLKTAKNLGLTIPPIVLMRATKVVK